MSLEAHPVTHIQVENVSVADYAQYITHATPVHVMTDGGPEGATMTFIEHTVLDPNQVLEPHQTIEVYQAIQQGGLEQVVLEQPIIAQITNGIAEPQSDIKPPVGKGPFNCELCDKVFKKWNQLQRHMKSHDEDKPFRCMQCNMSFNIEDNLILHQATHVPENGDPTCPECGKKFSRVASLKAHIMMHEKEENLMCPECGDEFSVQGQLDRHMQEHRDEHEGARRHSCRQCNQDFPKLAMLREHMKQHYKIKASLSHRTYKRNIDRSTFHHKCQHCTKTFQKPSQLLRHVRIHTGERPFKCKVCDKAFNQKGALQIHLSKHTGDKPHMCEFCPMTFAQKGNLRAHITRVHNVVKDGTRPTFECEECSCVFKKLGSLNAHISRAHTETSELPTQVEVRRVSPEEAKSINDTVIQQLLELSDQAGIETDDQDPEARQNLQKTGLDQDQAALAAGGASDILQQALENSGLTNGQPVSSPMINPSISTLTIHDAATGAVKKHIIRKVNGVRWHQCTYCSKEFKKPSDLVRHIRIHTHEKPYKCTQCFRSFAVKSTLTAHIKTHSGVKDYVCSVCQKLFSTQGSLKVHVRLHTGAKPFDCPHCEKKFRTSAHRKAHIHSHFQENRGDRRPRRNIRRSRPDVTLPDIPLQEPILITDTGLIQQPPRNNNVFNQYLGESGSVDRPYKCHYCRRCFKKSSHLKQHIRSHTGEKPYRCTQCFRAFVSSGVLKAHSRTHTGLKAYKCLICDSTFTTNGSLKRHMSTHSEVRPFMCPYCQKTFKTSVNCKKHMKTHRHELALQALQQDEQNIVPDPDPETQAVTDTVVTTDDLTQPQTTADLSVLQQDDIGHTTTITQQEMNPVTTISQQDLNLQTGAMLSQATLQDLTGTVIDHQLQQTLNQQVFGQGQGFGQAFLGGQQNFNQLGQTVTTSLSGQLGVGGQLTGQLTTPLGTQVTNTLNSQLSGQINSLNQNQFTMQPQSLASQIDVQQIGTTFSTQPTSSLSSAMTSTCMENILETREPEEAAVDSHDEGEIVIGQEDLGDGKRTYYCEYCAKSFKKSCHLKQHIRSHTGEKPYPCNVCGRMFVSTGVLKAHMKTHTGVKDFKCHICQATFTTNGSLTRHMMIHSSLRPFKCPFCNETFRTAVHCKRHMRIHRDGSGGVPPESVPGDEENQAPMTRRSKASIHITEDHTSELAKNPEEDLSVSEKILLESASEKDRVSEVKEKQVPVRLGKHPHQCNHCIKSFKKPSDLLRHIRIHTGEKPFNCDICNRSFTVKSTLDSHMKTHGPGQGDKRFKCHVCNSLFSTKGSLKVHMRLHTGAKPFKCPHCQGRFRTSGHRKSHILSHFKQDMPKKRKASSRSTVVDNSQNFPISMVNTTEVPVQAAGIAQQAVANQVVSIDPSLLQTQSIMPISLTVPDNLGAGLNESQLATQVLQGLEGIQLHFTSGLGQGIQIAGLDPSLLSQTVQIDASLLQQLQQQGNINITINPNVLTQVQTQDPNIITQTVQTADPNVISQGVQQADPNVLTQTVQADQNIITQTVPVGDPNIITQTVPVGDPNIITQTVPVGDHNLMQNIQLQPVSSLQDTVNPNVIVQPMSSVAAITPVEAQQALQAQNITLQQRQDLAGFVVPTDGMDSQVSVTHVQTADVTHMVVQEDQALMHVEQEDSDEDEDGYEEDEDDGEEGAILEEHNSTIVHDEEDDEGMDFQEAVAAVDKFDAQDSQRTHICQFCNKGFKRSSHLKEHLTTHTPGSVPKKAKPTPHRCETCDKAFQKPSQLMRHVRIHTGERPFVCNLCEKAFNQKNALQVHLKKHSGERPHQCSYCPLSFTQKGNLKTHIKRAHHLDMVQSMNLPRSFVPPANTTVSITSAPPSQADDEGLDLSEVVDLFQQ